MEFKRNTFEKLLRWKKSPDRKPLIIGGARQVGKTTLTRQFGETYDSYVELNLERSVDNQLFEIDETDKLLNAIFLTKGVSSRNQPILLFIDEIQENPKAIKMLRYLHEDRPEVHVVAAGSLLEFVLGEVKNFPVGRVEYLYLHPLNFQEFLLVTGNQMALEALFTTPIPSYAHEVLLAEFHRYALIGGMPGIIKSYLGHETPSQLARSYSQLWQSYQDDAEKYARSDSEKKILRHILATAAYEKDRIKFERFGDSNYRSREVGEALRALDLAKIIQLIYPTTALTAPIGPNIKKRPRLQFLDTGLLNHLLGNQAELIQLNSLDDFYRGRIIQHLIYQEYMSIHNDVDIKPYFWVRESPDSNAEVDMIIQHKQQVLPLEIKSGKTGRLRSLHQFINRSDKKIAIRMHSGTFNIEETATPEGRPYTLINIPYYLTTVLGDYIDKFV